jgi:non-canonical (house-cleaning) NTP pyrophosphatase
VADQSTHLSILSVEDIFYRHCPTAGSSKWSVRFSSQNAACARSVRKVSSHVEYLENRSRDQDVTWQPVRDLTAHRSTTLRLESRCALRLRYVDLVVGIEVAVVVWCCFTVFI